MKKRITLLSAISLCLSAVLIISGTSLSAEFKFREFKDDREKFEMYADKAEKSINEQDWQNILDSGKQEMLAEWERGTVSEMERYIRQGGDGAELRTVREESRADWESEYEKAESYALGLWYLKRENLVFDPIDFSKLKESVVKAGDETSVKTVNDWDSYVSTSLAGLNSSWDIQYLTPLANLKNKGELLTGDVKTGFETGLAAFENELKIKFEVERNSILYNGRNQFINELMVDTESLRYQSDSGSADQTTDSIIKEVQGSLKSEEDKILTKTYDNEGQSVIDFSVMGDNWEDELKQLVKTGIEKWNGALDRLYQQMLSWQQGAGEAYQSAEALWRQSEEKLEKARLDWETKLSNEVYEALDKWGIEQQSLSENIIRSRDDFTNYMNNLSVQWNDHSSGLVDMAINGSKVYTEALENIKWLEKMAAESVNSYAFNNYNEMKSYLPQDIFQEIETLIGQFGVFPNQCEVRTQFAGSSLNSDGTVLTEKYNIQVVSIIKSGTWLFPGGEYVLKSFEWENIVNDSSSDSRKSTYYYYKTELERWKKIEDSFKKIADDAEIYMHEKNMLGSQGGEGYLHNAGGSDPYLMTEAEFALKLAARDKVFWQSRLDIAKSVLDYAEKLKKDTAEETERKRSEAQQKMADAKTAYENALKGVGSIVLELKKLQGIKPASQALTEEWKTYTSSIEYLTEKYNAAGEKLQKADRDYSEVKRSIILLDNGENTEYLIKEIGEIEKRIVESERELYLKNIELYKTQMQSDFTDMTAGYSLNYQSAVKNYETSKFRFNTLKNILSGEESDTTLTAWAAQIINSKEIIWDQNADQNSSILQALITDYTPARREILSETIRKVYFTLMYKVDSAALVIEKLRDKNFNPDDFLKSPYTGDHEFYSRYAEISADALEIIENAFDECDTSGTKNYSSVYEKLKTAYENEKFVYGSDNTNYIKHYTALKYFEENCQGLDETRWEKYITMIETDREYSEEAADTHDEISGITDRVELDELISEKESDASEGDMDAASWLREYYVSLSGIAGLNYIMAHDSMALNKYNSNLDLITYVQNNCGYFRRDQDLLANHGYLQEIYGYINSKVALTISGNNPFAADSLKYLTPEGMSAAAGAFIEHVEKLAETGVPVPDFLKTAALSIADIKEKLDRSIFIQRYMAKDTSPEMAGSVDDVYNRKALESGRNERLMVFLDDCSNVLETTGVDDYILAENILNTYEKLSEDDKKFIKDHTEEKIRNVGLFIEKLYLNKYLLSAEIYAGEYIGAGSAVEPGFYADSKGLTGDARERLIAKIKPSYYRNIYNTDSADGKVSDIKTYIDEMDIDSADKEELLSYALIKEFINGASGENLISTDPAFTAYIKYLKFEKFITGFTRNSGESDDDYIERSITAYGGTADEYTGFARDLLAGDKTAFYYLDDCVKIYEASNYYYTEIFSRNRVLKTGIDTFLEEKFGKDSVDGDLEDGVKTNAGRLNAVSLYFGNDPVIYVESLEADAARYFTLYMSGTSEAILPGFEYGLYETSEEAAGLPVVLENITTALDKFMESYAETADLQAGYTDAALAGLANAEALKLVYTTGSGEKNWRDSVIAVIDKTETPGDTGNADTTDDIVITETKVIIPMLYDAATGWFDGFNAETDLRETIIYSRSYAERDGKKYSGNSIIDEMNMMKSAFDSISESLKGGIVTGNADSITAFLAKADTNYKYGNNYTAGAGGIYSFESALTALVSGYETGRDDLNDEISELAGGITGYNSVIDDSKDSLNSKKGSYDLLAGKKPDELLAELESRRIVHEAAKKEFESEGKKLSAARTKYEAKNKEYTGKMQEVSTTYSSYQTLEFSYEKAYAVWEYANTPYLKENITDSPDLENSASAGDSLPAPDARDYYEKVKKQYDKAVTAYDTAAAAKASQYNTVELNSDPVYKELKADFIRKSKSFIRIAQVNTEVKEDLDLYKEKYEIAKKIYENFKDSFNIYFSKLKDMEGEGDEYKASLARARDEILNHILKTGKVVDNGIEFKEYENALLWYSCVLKTEVYEEKLKAELIINGLYPGYNGDIDNLKDKIKSLKSYVNSFNSLTEVIKNDTIRIYNEFNTSSDGDNLNTILDNYPGYIYWHYMYKEADDKYDSLSKYNYSGKRKWKNKKKDRKKKYKKHENNYERAVSPILTDLADISKSKADYAEKASIYKGISSVRYIEDIKKYLKQGKYGLTDEDLSHLYDSSMTGYVPDDESVNLDVLRDISETARLDLDGAAVYAKVINGKIVVLDKDGNATTETYALTNDSLKLKKDGKVVGNYAADTEYEIYDRLYNIDAVIGVMKERAAADRQEYLAGLVNFAESSTADARRDKTIVLRDLEKTYHGLQEYAVGFNYKNAAVPEDDKEVRQRGLEGYITITREYVNNGSSKSIQGMIVESLITQSRSLQEKLWEEQQDKFDIRKNRWSEVAAYIMNRGKKEWQENYGEFKSRWSKWRFDAKKMIADGEEWWTGVNSGIMQEMNTWTEETSRASSKEAAERIYSGLDERISKYEKDLKNRMPGNSGFSIDTDKILKESMKNNPVDSIGILTQSMLSTDTTAGFTDILNLGLDGSLLRHNEEQMKEYSSAMGVMKNLKVVDILNEIIAGFNKQLETQNEKIYDAFGGFAKGEDINMAPFRRNKAENQWSIKVCTESTLTGDKYKTRKFSDYRYFVNETVFLMTLKGLNGKTIDFTNANTYVNIDAAELETYVGLETEKLSREIDNTFKNPNDAGEGGGLFSRHIDAEQNRLGNKFEDYYIEWAEGEAMLGMTGYNKPIAHGAPSVMVSLSIGAQVGGFLLAGPAGAAIGQFAASVLTTGLDMADGQLSWQHAGAQVGTGLIGSGAGIFAPVVSGSLQGIDYEDGGGVGWNNDMFKDGLRSGVKEMGVRAAVGNIPGLSDMASSWVDTDGGWGDWGFDNGNWGDHLISGFGGAIGAAGLPGQSGQLITEIIRSSAYNIGDGKGFEDQEGIDEEMFNWNLFRGNASTVGALLPQMVGYALNGMPDGKGDSSKPGDAPAPDPMSADPLQQADEYLGGLWYGNRSWSDNVSNIFGRIAANITAPFESISEIYNNKENGGITGLLSAYAGKIGSDVMNSLKSWSVTSVLATAGSAVLGGLQSFGKWLVESVSNLFSDNDDPVRDKNEDARLTVLEHQIDEKMKEYREGKITQDELQKKLAEYEGRISAIENDAAYAKMDKKGVWYTTFENSKEAVDYIQTKKELGLDVTEEDRELLARTLWQASDKPLSNEMKDMISANKDLFKKIKGLDVNDPESVAKFADKFASKACVMNVLFMNIVTSSLKDGVPASFGDMYLKLMKDEKIQGDGISLTGSINDLNNLQNIVNTIIGDDNSLKVNGYSINQGLSSKEVYNKFFEVLQDSNILNVGGRMSGHSIYLFNQGDTWGEYDSGRPGKRSPRPYGQDYDKDFKPYNTSSFYWLTTP